MEKTLILTVLLEENSQKHFDVLRARHFPKEINYLKAHLTLFHKLPASDLTYDRINALVSNQKSFSMHVNAVVSIGNGVAFKIESPELQHIHAELQSAFAAVLTAQDKQKLWPHITVQNKVTAIEAKALKEELEKSFNPQAIEAKGLVLSEYLNGPWQLHRLYPFI